jgi:aminotransferase
MKDDILQKFGFEFRVENMSAKVNEVSLSAIKSIVAIASQLDDVISFAWGIPPFATAEFVRQDICKMLADKSNIKIDQYSLVGGIPRLKQAFAQKLQIQKGIELEPQKEILVTCGAMEAIRISLEAIVNPGDEVILFSPSFPSHHEQILLAMGKPVYVPLIEEKEWRVDFAGLNKAISKKTKALLITSPNNPTGNVLTKAELNKIAQLAEEHNLLVISDETYDYLTYDEVQHISALTLPQFRQRFIVCFSCSKKYSMSGWRVGFVCAEAGIIQQLQKVHDATVVCVPTISQLAAISAIEGPEDYLKEHLAIYEQRRQTIGERLDRLASVFEYILPQGAYYIFPKIKNQNIDDVNFCLEVLKSAKVAIVPGSAFGPSGKGHFRMVFGVAEEEIHRGFDRLEKYFKV